MLSRTFTAFSLAAALMTVAPVASAQHDRDYRDDHRNYRHDSRGDHRDHRDHRAFERERLARARHYEYARHHDYRLYAPRGYAVAAPVFVPPPVVYSPPPSGINIVVPITLP